ncbi:MAG: hypothetical protein M1826_000828 [Phylliscum demangeonii]|nr:MAG: hypothetical protein M1826_000828 [Phylliscum demangeonii]
MGYFLSHNDALEDILDYCDHKGNKSVCGDVSRHAGTEAEKEAFRRAQHAWLVRFNGLPGDVAGRLIRGLLNLDYVEMVDALADITVPPCPGQMPNLNRFLTSIQVNCATPPMPPLSFSVAINASMMRGLRRARLLLFAVLDVTVPVQPGGIVIFAEVEYHRATPWSPPLTIPPQWTLATGPRNLRSLQRDGRRHREFSSAEARDLWISRDGLLGYANHLQRQLQIQPTIGIRSTPSRDPPPTDRTTTAMPRIRQTPGFAARPAAFRRHAEALTRAAFIDGRWAKQRSAEWVFHHEDDEQIQDEVLAEDDHDPDHDPDHEADHNARAKEVLSH